MKKSRVVGPGPVAGSVIVTAGKTSGPVRGIPGPRPKPGQLRTLREGRRVRTEAAVARKAETVADVEEALVAAHGGDFSALNAVNVRKLARHHAMHDKALDAVEKDGVILNETTLDAEGRPIATRARVHPGADFALRLADNLGVSADAQMLTPKARGAGRRDEALTLFLERERKQAELRASLGAIDTEVVFTEEDDEDEKGGTDAAQ